MSDVGQSLDFNVTSGSMPQGFKPATWQQVADTMASRLQISLNRAYALFNIGSVLPTSNQGPFLLNGLQWYVWSNDLARYILMPIDQSQLMFFIGQSAPDPAVYKIWWRTDSDGNAMVPYWFNPALTPSPGQWQPFGYSTKQIDAFFPGTDTITGFKEVNWAQVLNAPALISSSPSSGTTAQRPTPSQSPALYFDTDINCLLIYYTGSWHTVDGSPGDVKFVNATTLAAALLQNPGWAQNAAANKRVLIAADDTSGYTVGATGGSATATLAQENLPSTVSDIGIASQNGSGPGAACLLTTGQSVIPGTLGGGLFSIDPFGSDTPVPTLSPYVAYWCLVKN